MDRNSDKWERERERDSMIKKGKEWKRPIKEKLFEIISFVEKLIWLWNLEIKTHREKEFGIKKCLSWQWWTKSNKIILGSFCLPVLNSEMDLKALMIGMEIMKANLLSSAGFLDV